MRTVVFLSLFLGGSVIAARPVTSQGAPNQAVLKPLSLSAACRQAGYVALQDAAGTLRVLRYVRLVPDNSARLTQYYASSGRLQSLKATASGFAGVLYNLKARVDTSGNIISETGYRSKLFTRSLRSVLRDAEAVRAGKCGL